MRGCETSPGGKNRNQGKWECSGASVGEVSGGPR